MNEIAERTVRTGRIDTHVREAGEGEPVLFVHGNLSDGGAWTGQLQRLVPGARGIAPDLRGYGASEPAPVNARRGVRDYADDLIALLDALELPTAHVVGHSLGGGVAMQLAVDHPQRVRSLVLVAPVGPHGYGGTRADGTPCQPDWAGSGGGTANAELVRRIAEGDRSDGDPVSPRSIVRTLFFPGAEAVRDEELLLDGILASRVGDDHYPGDATASEHWPGVAPGTRGVLNAISARWLDLTPFAQIDPRPPVVWVRGSADAIVADGSRTDLGHLGAIGAVPGWPGAETFPAQPMVAQTRALLARYAEEGGVVREVVWDGVGHFPYIERPDAFGALLAAELQAVGA